MKVLFIASNAKNEETLRIEQEITELQRIAFASANNAIQFIFLPALPFEELENLILAQQPDIVHIVAHGEPGKVFLADSYEAKVALTVEAVKSLLGGPPEHRAKLVYINSCNSLQIAKGIVDTVPFAIGTTAEISNFGARKGAVNFYRALSQGRSIDAAYNSAKTTVAALERPETGEPDGGAEMVLCCADDAPAPEQRKLFEPTRLVARFTAFEKDAGEWNFEIGVVGCPDTTVQVVVCTDDESFLDDRNEPDPVERLCSVVVTTARRGEIWLNEAWRGIYGDVRLYAILISAGGSHISISGTLCEALQNYYNLGGSSTSDQLAVLSRLKDADGSYLRTNPAITRRRTDNRSKARNKKR